TRLIVIQTAGAISFVPYPFIFLANVMSIAAEGQTVRGAIPYVLLSVYPAIWIGLDVAGWRALSRGSTGPAFTLSMVPMLATLGAVALWMLSDKPQNERDRKRAEEIRANVQPANPLTWTIMCTR